MFLRCTKRKKDGKEHQYWSIVENQRVRGGKVVQRHVLYLGEINDAQQRQWLRTIEVIEGQSRKARQVALFPDDRRVELEGSEAVQVRLKEMELHRPRQWGACWCACELWKQLELDDFWSARLPRSRKGTAWLHVLKTLAIYRLLDPGSEWRLHRTWFNQSAMGDLLGEDFAIAEIHKLYRCLDLLLPHKAALFSHLKTRWQTLFGLDYEVLLYDLTSTYFECDPPEHDSKKKYGYSRDKRFDCVQVVIGLVVTPDGVPLAYEVLAGNTRDCTTLRDFLKKIEAQYGKAKRVWVMDRGIPTEEVLSEMRASDPPVSYLVGTPRGRLTKLERDFLSLPWDKVKGSVEVKLLPKDGEVYVLARSTDRAKKERGIRRRRLKKFWRRLKELRTMELKRDTLLEKVAVAKSQAGNAHKLVDISLPKAEEAVTPQTFTFKLNKRKLRETRKKEGTYLLRSNLTEEDPTVLWQRYVQLTEVEQAFKNLKDDLVLRPIFHQREERIEAHIFVAFLAYCLHVTLRLRAKALASGLTPRTILDKFATMQMLDVHFPTVDNRWLVLPRFTQPDKDVSLLLHQLKLTLPQQPPPTIYSTRPSTRASRSSARSEDFQRSSSEISVA